MILIHFGISTASTFQKLHEISTKIRKVKLYNSVSPCAFIIIYYHSNSENVCSSLISDVQSMCYHLYCSSVANNLWPMEKRELWVWTSNIWTIFEFRYYNVLFMCMQSYIVSIEIWFKNDDIKFRLEILFGFISALIQR